MRLAKQCASMLIVAAAVASGVGCNRASAAGPAIARTDGVDSHTRPRALALDAGGELLYVALSTADRLAVLDVSRVGDTRLVTTLPVCAFPAALAALPSGGVVVACRFDPGLRVVTPPAPPSVSTSSSASSQPRFDVRVVDAGPVHGHQGVVVEPTGRFAYVASPALGGVKIVSLLAGGPAVRVVTTGLSPRILHLTPEDQGAGPAGERAMFLLVSNFIGHTVTVHRVQGDGGLSPPVQTISTAAPVLALATTRPSPSAAPGTQPAAGALGGSLLLATHEDRQLSRAQISVEGLDSVLLVLRRAPAGQAVPFVDAGPGRRPSINLTEARAEPLVGLDALAVDAVSGALAVVGSGSDNLLLSPPGQADLLALPAVAVGTHPSAAAFLPAGRVVTADRLSDTLSVVSLADRSSAAAAPRIETVVVGVPARRTPVEHGEVLFYSRALVPNNVATGPLSVYTCAACHADGQIDGRLHPSKRNKFFSMTKTCRGLVGTEPFLSLGKPHTFAAFADNIVATHAQGVLDSPQTFDRYSVQLRLRAGGVWRMVSLSPDGIRAALAAYMISIPVEPSPFVAPGQRMLDLDQRRGLATFRENCAGCHQLFRTTDRERAIPPGELERRLLRGQVALTSARLYDVGTPVLGEGGNNPPSLRNVWAAAPYFSDGSAADLEAVLRRTNPRATKVHAPENAGQAGAFSGTERADLLAFLRAL